MTYYIASSRIKIYIFIRISKSDAYAYCIFAELLFIYADDKVFVALAEFS